MSDSSSRTARAHPVSLAGARWVGRWRTRVSLVAAMLLVLAGPQAAAAPVALSGPIIATTTTQCAPWCGGLLSGADAEIDADSGLANGQFRGSAFGWTSAEVAGGGWFGKTAAATATAEWWAAVHAPDDHDGDPFNLYFDWNLWLFANHDAMLGQAVGGAEMTVRWYECRPWPTGPGCSSFLTFEKKRVYNDSISAQETWDLGLYNSNMSYGRLNVLFTAGGAVSTTPILGVYATASDVATFGFTLRADDGLPPPQPTVPEPGTLSAALAAMGVLGLLRRRRASPARS